MEVIEKVIHKTYGVGQVVEQKEKSLYIDFDGEVLIFPIPEAFEKGFLLKV